MLDDDVQFDADRGKGALYVVTRSGGVWTHQARIQAENAENGDSLGYSLAISDDGNTLVAGAADEDCMTPGVNPPGCDKDQPQDNSSGAAYVFVRNGTTWLQQAFLKSSLKAQSPVTGYPLEQYDLDEVLGTLAAAPALKAMPTTLMFAGRLQEVSDPALRAFVKEVALVQDQARTDFRASIPGATTMLVADASHYVHVERPDAVIEAVRSVAAKVRPT